MKLSRRNQGDADPADTQPRFGRFMIDDAADQEFTEINENHKRYEQAEGARHRRTAQAIAVIEDNRRTENDDDRLDDIVNKSEEFCCSCCSWSWQESTWRPGEANSLV